MKIALILLVLGVTACGQMATGYVWPSQAAVGVEYEAHMPTHCGARDFEMNGSWWHFVGNPDVTNWPDPYDKGTFWLIDESHGAYRGSRGVELPVEKGGTPPNTCL